MLTAKDAANLIGAIESLEADLSEAIREDVIGSPDTENAYARLRVTRLRLLGLIDSLTVRRVEKKP